MVVVAGWLFGRVGWIGGFTEGTEVELGLVGSVLGIVEQEEVEEGIALVLFCW